MLKANEKCAILKRFMNTHKASKILGFLLALFLLSVPASISAAPFDFIGATADSGFGSVEFLHYVSMINTFMHIVLLVVLNFVQYLLQADFFTNPAMMSAMNNVWKLSRDVVNVIFAVMLIGVALYTIVTADKKYVTEKLQSFVIAVILVNLSWFFPRVIIDVANIMTSTVYTIPQFLPAATCEVFDDTVPGGKLPCKVMVDVQILDGFAGRPNPVTGEPFCPGGVTSDDCVCNENIGCYKMGLYRDIASAKTMGVGHLMINGLVVNFAKVLNLVKIPQAIAGPGAAAGGKVVSLQILMGVLFALLIQLAVLLPLIGLVIGLLIRIVILWVTIAFMPFTFIGYVINGKLGTDFGFGVDIWKEFISAAFLPMFVAIPITIGFIMLLTVVNVPSPSGFPLTFGVPLIYGVRSWWTMLWMVAAIGILWKGAFAALKKSEFIGGFTEKIKGFGENIFSAAMHVPLITPLPLPGMNLGTLFNAPRIGADVIRTVARGTSGTTVPALLRQSLNPQGAGAGAPVNAATIDRTTELFRNDVDNTNKIVLAIAALKNTGSKQAFMDDAAIKMVINHLGPQASAQDVLTHLQAVAQPGKLDALVPHLADINTLLQEEINRQP